MPDASHDFGAHLRQAREQRGVSLREIAERTKISVLALEALERNDVSRLPGGIFTRAFVRSYASEVGLDPEDTVRRFLARFPDESTDESPRTYEPNPEHISVDEPPTFGRAWRAVAWSIPLLLVVGYFGFGGRLPWWGDSTPKPAPRTTSEVPTPPPPAPPVVQPQSAPAAVPDSVPAPAAPDASPAQNAPAPVQPAADQKVGGVAGKADASTGKVDGSTGKVVVLADKVGGAGEKAAVDASAPGAFRLTLAPREECWVSVRSNGASLYSALMRPGDRHDLVVRGDVSLTVGNAGGFAYWINDQPGRALGNAGQPTTVRLNAANLTTFIEAR